MQINLSVWDDDTEENGDDLIDSFTIPILSSFLDSPESKLQTFNGTEGIVNLTLEFYNLTSNPSSCSAEDNPTVTSNLLPTGNLNPLIKYILCKCKFNTELPNDWINFHLRLYMCNLLLRIEAPSNLQINPWQ